MAAYALEHPDEFALSTASALARNAEVQASTLVRFAQTLGFAGFSELQELFRSHLRDRSPDYSDRLRALQQDASDSGDPTNLLFGFANSAAASIARLREVVRRRELDQAVSLLAQARTIHCLGQRRAFCVAHYLTYALSQLGVSASLIDNVGGLGPEELAQAGPHDALIAVSFSPYTPFTVDLSACRGAKTTFGTRNKRRRDHQRDPEHRHEREVKRLFERGAKTRVPPPRPRSLAPAGGGAAPTTRPRGQTEGGRN